jgi:HD-GYP domain-containing protein (c-di-GMP phosphodiesterase class II)
MSEVVLTTPTTEDQGRLPSNSAKWPISRDRFAALASVWRGCDVWLSLWNAQGQPLTQDEHGPQFWNRLWAQAASFRNSLGEIARAATAQAVTPASGGERGIRVGNFIFNAAPLRHRTRIVGVLLGAVVHSSEPTEDFARLCNQCGVDAKAMLGLLAKAGRVDERAATRLGGLLVQAADQARASEIAEEEIRVLTQNLQNTYEEQALIYRVSSEMGLPQRPATLLAKVGDDVLKVSRTAAVGFVLTEVDAEDGSGEKSISGDRLVQIGHVAPSLPDLDRLAESLGMNAADVPPHLLFNNSSRRPELQWARPWLQNLVALPLKQHKTLHGVMLAMNCTDKGDFTSVDVQLLRAVADRVTAFLENQRLYDDLANLLMALLHALVNSVDAKDPYTYGHSERVAHISRALAAAAGLSVVECDRVYLAGLLHDVGKIGVPDAILCKPGKLTKEEFDALKKHPEIGVRILSPVKQIRDLLPGVLYHHERMDGRGYPEGLTGEKIPRLGQIICLADSFDAMTSNRTYRSAMPLPQAIEEIRRCSGSQFEPELSELFLQLDLENYLLRDRPVTVGPPSIGHLGSLSRRS